MSFLKGQIVHQDRQVRVADRDQFLADTYPLTLDIINVGEGYDVRAMYPAKTIPVQKLLDEGYQDKVSSVKPGAPGKNQCQGGMLSHYGWH